jgi:hypothetical protein
MKGYLLFDEESEKEIYKPYRVNFKERLISKNENDYYDVRKTHFFTRPLEEKVSKKVLSKKAKFLLKEIMNILNKNQTKYSIIITPLYNEKMINTEDLLFLENLFGKKNVFNFSGQTEFSKDKHNYFEVSHFRPHVGRLLMDKIYQSQ